MSYINETMKTIRKYETFALLVFEWFGEGKLEHGHLPPEIVIYSFCSSYFTTNEPNSIDSKCSSVF